MVGSELQTRLITCVSFLWDPQNSHETVQHAVHFVTEPLNCLTQPLLSHVAILTLQKIRTSLPISTLLEPLKNPIIFGTWDHQDSRPSLARLVDHRATALPSTEA